jgi:hypothetical protein
MTAESSDNQEDGAKVVAITFSIQGVGWLAVLLAAWALVSIFPEDSALRFRYSDLDTYQAQASWHCVCADSW